MQWHSNFQGRPLTWAEMEQILSGKHRGTLAPVVDLDSKRRKHVRTSASFVELHAASSYSFLRGANTPQEMAEAAQELGMPALALLDRDGVYGAVEFSRSDIATIFGAELTLKQGVLAVLCKDPEGYRTLCHIITEAKMRGDKDHCVYPPLSELAKRAAGHWYVLADHDWVPHAKSLQCFGPDLIWEYVYSLGCDDDQHRMLDQIPGRRISTARPLAATQQHSRLAMAKQALARRQTMQEAIAEIPYPSWLRIVGTPEQQAETLAIAQECAFTFDVIRPGLPHWPVRDEMKYLSEMVWKAFQERSTAFDQQLCAAMSKQLEHELKVIAELDFPGYFLIVHDIVEFCRRENILCQGRGSAASSVVCFVLGITTINPVQAQLLFERFLSRERSQPPDIDIDIESGRREEVIQYVYQKYGREYAAQVANVITYRKKGARRDASRAIGASQHQDTLAEQLYGQPRHLGIHSGGMILCDRPIADVVPMEWARMHGRTVVQWDKDSCADAGLVKFDLLGLGMLSALHSMLDLVAEKGETVHLWQLDFQDPAVYDLLCAGDAIGVFQVESRAQMAMLPRLRPRTFFDLVVQVALIRPGPIQGGSVHPYLRRRCGEEAVTYDHPILRKALKKTLGVPLFQEQIMQIAIDAANFSGGEADQMRRAMGSKRSESSMQELRSRFFQGLAENGVECGEKLWKQIMAFAAYGFPEAHAQSFAALVYYSAWFKRYHPAEFYVGLLRAQPMGFYSPQSLLADARRHHIRVLPVCVNNSKFEATIESGAIRLGLTMVRGIAQDISQYAPFHSAADLARIGLDTRQISALAKAGALDCFGGDRRQALWQAGVAATEQPDMLPGLSALHTPALPGLSALELVAADIMSTGVSHQHPMELFNLDVAKARDLEKIADGTRVRIAGVITHRQRPSQMLFLSVEDETGIVNVLVSPGLQKREPRFRTAQLALIRGRLQQSGGVCALMAEGLEPLYYENLSAGSRDFR